MKPKWWIARLCGLAATAALVGLGPAQAFASDWQVIEAGVAGSLSIERSMLKRHGQHALVWVRATYFKPQNNLLGGQPYDTVLTQVDIDCAGDTAMVTGNSWAYRGAIVSSSDTPLPAGDIQPDSVLATVEQEVCKS